MAIELIVFVLEGGKWIRQYSIIRPDHSSLNEVLEFANIARPRICNECIHGCRGYLFNKFPHPSSKYFDEMQDQLAYILSALSQGRNQDRKHIQPVIKITAEFILELPFGPDRNEWRSPDAR